MKFIIEFYKELDMLNLIIFWGIIIVIILLLIFSMIMINKNKKLKNMLEKQKENEEEFPIIKQEETTIENNIQEEDELEEIIMEPEEKSLPEDIDEYRNDLFELSNEKKDIELEKENKIELPSAPYQRNVLREMSLSQTSPIGINRDAKVDKKLEIVNDLDESLDEEIVEEKFNIKTETSAVEEDNIYHSPNELLEKENTFASEEKKHNEYLEEVSRKLSEAEVPDEIERTNYEIQQEEDAIISYKELMEKKDSIQTIDEEDAVISIEELMNRNNKNKEEDEISKLYNLSEEEENENFIKELKQFRNDL